MTAVIRNVASRALGLQTCCMCARVPISSLGTRTQQTAVMASSQVFGQYTFKILLVEVMLII